MERIRGIVFDLDGTLADTFEDIASCVNHVRCLLGLPPLSLADVKRHVGKGVKNLIQKTTDITDQNHVEQLCLVFKQYYLEHLLDSTRLYEGVVQGLDLLYSKAVSMAVLSNKPEDATKKIVEGLGIARFFKAIFGGDSFEKQKPARESLLGSLKVLNVDASQALMVGDSLVDVETALNAGTRCVVVTTGLLEDMESIKESVLFVAENILEVSNRLESMGLV